MNRKFLRVPALLGLSFPYPENQSDKLEFKGNVTAEEYAKVDPLRKTGLEGLKRMWSYNEVGDYSQEVKLSIRTAFYSGILGGFIMGMRDGKEAFGKWMRVNLSTKFINEADARKYLLDAINLGVFKGFFMNGMKVTLFVGSYMLVANSLRVYRGKMGVTDFVVGGAFAGGALRFWFGPRAFIVGIGLGSIVGLFGGVSSVLLFKVFGTSVEELQDWQMEVLQKQERLMKEGQKPEWQQIGQNAMLERRTYNKEADLFKVEQKP